MEDNMITKRPWVTKRKPNTVSKWGKANVSPTEEISSPTTNSTISYSSSEGDYHQNRIGGFPDSRDPLVSIDCIETCMSPLSKNADESIGKASLVMPFTTPSSLEPITHRSADWAIPKWKELESKRLALCQKRVQLERRLFEFSESALRSDVVGTFQVEKQQKVSSAASTASQSSISSHDSRAGDIFHLRRYQLRKDQDPVLWSGEVNRKNQPEGIGRMVFSDGQVYEGFIMAGLREGKGVNVWPNGQVYTGSWHHNSRSGRGTHRWPDGRTVTGPWLNGHLHGRVFFRWPDGATYDGDTVKGQKEGRGIHTWKDGRVYSGQYRNGAENGFGILTERSQHTKYRGQFKDGKRNGYGIQIWNTKTYDGEWYHNMIHGRGKLSWLSGACYTGEFQKGRYHGYGCYRSENGTKFVGQWKDGCKHGQGKQYWPDGRVYQGAFDNNNRHGYGRMSYPDGTVYTGGWERGKRSGRGIEVTTLIDELAGESVREILHCGLWKSDEAVHPSEGQLEMSRDDLELIQASWRQSDDDSKLAVHDIDLMLDRSIDLG